MHTGELISRANSDVRAVQQYLVTAPTVFVQCAVVIVAFAEMFTISVPLTLVTMVSLPLTFLFGIIMRKRISSGFLAHPGPARGRRDDRRGERVRGADR